MSSADHQSQHVDVSHDGRNCMQTSSKMAKSFCFTQLPAEISLRIFWFIQSLYTSEHPDKSSLKQATLPLLLVNKTCLQLFGPTYYQNAFIVFKDPVMFSLNFLDCCTSLCLANIRSMHCRLTAWPGNNQPQSSYEGPLYSSYNVDDVQSLQDVLCTNKTDLPNLHEFKLTWDFDDYIVAKPEDVGGTSDTPLWNRFDKHRQYRFSAQTNLLNQRPDLLQGFTMKHEVVFVDPGWMGSRYWNVKEMSLVYIRPSGTSRPDAVPAAPHEHPG